MREKHICDIISDFLFFIMLVSCFGAIVGLLTGLTSPQFDVEVESYTVGCEISHMDVVLNSTNRKNYIMCVRNDDFATSFYVEEETFANHMPNEIVEVEVRVMEDSSTGEQKTYYSLVEESG